MKDIRSMLGAFGLPMSKVAEGELMDLAREVFDISAAERDVAAAIFAMTKKQRSRMAWARAPAIAERLRSREVIERPLTQEDADAAEREIMARCKASIRRMEQGPDRQRVLASFVGIFGERAARYIIAH